MIVIPTPRFDLPTSTVVFSAEGELLGARISDDGQWRFPKTGEVPLYYKKAVLAFEDRWFYFHPGINPVAIVRALFLNMKRGEIVSGGSTISMQVARLSRNNPERTVSGKLLEMAMAMKLEVLKSKAEILRMYASTAPFGGNVVGIDAAAWRYFNRPATQLTWAEAATLAILPNSPSMLYPGKNHDALKNKRDRLLHKLHRKGLMDDLTLMASLAELLPSKPLPLPTHALHTVEKMSAMLRGQNVTTTINYSLQKKINQTVLRHQQRLVPNHIYNVAVVVVEVETGNIVAYAGNTPDVYGNHGGHVDVADAPRSSGSILKPFLYASMLQYGEMLPNTLVPDIPVNYSGYTPKNFDFSYSGAIKASQALSQSLNVPAVDMLQHFGEAKFLSVLRSLGFTTFRFPAEHYGLSLILGGGENKLTELTGAYASLARVLNHYTEFGGYSKSDIFPPSFLPREPNKKKWDAQTVLSASSIWFTFQALLEVNRPEERSGWEFFASGNKVAWKTGTSFGFRDAWAVGTNPKYVVGVWAGNSDGEGRPGLTGVRAAAPVLFDILDLLPSSHWFDKPEKEITYVDVCAESGYRVSPVCPHAVRSEVPLSALKTEACPYHHLVHLSEDRLWQVNASCYPIAKIVHDSCFVLPPGMEWYYRKIHPEYAVLPPLMKGCGETSGHKMIELLYPKNLVRLFVPRELDGSMGKVVFEAAHRNMNTRLFWHLDDEYIGETSQFHQMALSPMPGEHILTIFDIHGNTLKKRFKVEGDLRN